MNQTQLKYALGRVDEIANQKALDLRKRHAIPAKYISDTERCDLVRAGKVKLRAGVTRIKTYDDVVNVFDFSKYVADETLPLAYDKALAALKSKASAARDEIMLGDELVARGLIDELERV